MTLTLVASADGRALAIREHLLPLIRSHGILERQIGVVRLVILQLDPWLFKHWTPFRELHPDEASLPGYRTCS